jgi:hypothetical protein
VRGGEFGADTIEMLVNALLYSTREPVSCFTERGHKERKKGTGSRERSSWYRATLKRCSKCDEAGKRSIRGSSARESPVVRSVAWSKNDMCCVSSLALTSKGS